MAAACSCEASDEEHVLVQLVAADLEVECVADAVSDEHAFGTAGRSGDQLCVWLETLRFVGAIGCIGCFLSCRLLNRRRRLAWENETPLNDNKYSGQPSEIGHRPSAISHRLIALYSRSWYLSPFPSHGTPYQRNGGARDAAAKW